MTDPNLEDEKSSQSNISDKASKIKGSGKTILNKGIQKGKEVTDKVTDATTEAVIKIDKTMRKVGQEISDEIIKQSVNVGSMMSKSGHGNAFEKQLFSWYGWFMSSLGYVIVILIAFTISATDPKYSLLPIILLIGFPFFILWMIYNIIPEVSIGGRTIISRKQVSLRRQMSFGRAIARTFSREMWKNSPEMAVIILVFLLFLIYALISPLL